MLPFRDGTHPSLRLVTYIIHENPALVNGVFHVFHRAAPNLTLTVLPAYKFGFIVGVAYVLFSPRREKSTKRAPPRAGALWKPVCAFMYLFDRGYTRHRSEIFAPQEPAETNISKRRQTQPKADARPPLPPAFILRRNTRPPTVKRRTCRLIVWGGAVLKAC